MPIVWRVLDVHEGEALLLSEYALAAQPVQSQNKTFVDWETSDLKQWLTGEFSDKAFTPAEKRLFFNGEGPNLPSVEQIKNEAYGFKQSKDRLCKATPFAATQKLLGQVSYWLSTPAKSNANSLRCALHDGGTGFAAVASNGVGVRPILRINLGDTPALTGEGSLKSPYVLAEAVQKGTEGTPTPPTTTPSPTSLPATVQRSFGQLDLEGFPPLTDEGFLAEGEFVSIDEEKGVWRYASPTLRVCIDRRTMEKGPVRYLDARIYAKDEQEVFHTVPFNKDHLTENRSAYRVNQTEIARKNQVVFALNSDYYLYRMTRQINSGATRVGLIVRNGQLLFEDGLSSAKTSIPPLHSLALFPDGDMKVYGVGEVTAQALLEQGARDVLCFGPYLIRDGKLNPDASKYGPTLQPRVAIGMVEKGFYRAVVVEGRIKGSKGMSCMDLGKLMHEMGCTLAFNLDGGWTSCMVFMGNQLNQLDKEGSRARARDQNEILGIGTTALMEQYAIKTE